MIEARVVDAWPGVQVKLKKPVEVDFRQQGSLEQVLKISPQRITSREADWRNLHFERHYQRSHQTPEHQPAQHVVAIQTAGQVEADRQLDGIKQHEQTSAGSVCLVPAQASHAIRVVGEQELIFLSLEPEFLQQVAYDAIATHAVELIPHFAKADPFIAQIGLSLSKVLENDPTGSQFYAETLTAALAAHLLQFYSVRGLSRRKESLPDTRIQQSIDYIQAHLHEELSLAAIAQAVGLSQYHFCRAFKRVVGVSPWQYVIQQRVEAAKRFLALPKLSIAEISRQMGFSSQAQFTTFFRKHVDLTPTAYRKRL